MHITSGDNGRLRLVRKLSSKKHRDSLGMFVAEGSNLVGEALSRGADIDFILVSEQAVALHAGMLGSADVDIHTVDRQLFSRLTDAENGIDVLAVIRKPGYDIQSLSKYVGDGDNILVLDRVQDPGNIGSLIRTAAAAGYRAVICIKGTGDVFSPKVLRSTAGLIYAVPVVNAADAGEAVEAVRSLGKSFAVTVPSGGTCFYDLDLSRDIALVIGNEGNGVSDEIAGLADILITIPMEQGVESLNAAISGSIIMYESIRQRIKK